MNKRKPPNMAVFLLTSAQKYIIISDIKLVKRIKHA